MILIEENFNGIDVIEEGDGTMKKRKLRGIFSEIGNRNRNGRIYNEGDMIAMMNEVNERARVNQHILGECDHPSTLNVSLSNVSHKMTKMWRDGNIIYGEAEILDKTPKGAIIAGLMESGINLGVSSRGGGTLNESGEVRNFRYVTHDIVARPSVASAVPQSVFEELRLYERGDIIDDLSESIQHDPIAQKYFQMELKRFLESLRN